MGGDDTSIETGIIFILQFSTQHFRCYNRKIYNSVVKKKTNQLTFKMINLDALDDIATQPLAKKAKKISKILDGAFFTVKKKLAIKSKPNVVFTVKRKKAI